MTLDRWFPTRQMRSSDHAMWVFLRRYISAMGVDPQTSIIDAFPDGVDDVNGVEMDTYHCILVTQDRRVFVFRLGARREQVSPEWTVHRWQDQTEAPSRATREPVRWAYEQMDAGTD